jgi:hypothetical protein
VSLAKKGDERKDAKDAKKSESQENATPGNARGLSLRPFLPFFASLRPCFL